MLSNSLSGMVWGKDNYSELKDGILRLSTKQGCFLSPLLCNRGLEILDRQNIKLTKRNNKKINKNKTAFILIWKDYLHKKLKRLGFLKNNL